MRLVVAVLIGGLLPLLGPSKPGYAQPQSLRYQVTTTAYGSGGGSLPFWQYANTRGRIRPGSSANGLLSAGLERPFQHDGGLDISAGISAVGRLSDTQNTLHVLDLYGRLQYRGVRLSVGRFPDTIAQNRPTLSVGSMMMSRNAPPVPKIKLATPHFLDVPFTRGYVQVRARWSDGVLGTHRTVERPFVHQKAFYLKGTVGAVSVVGGVVQNTVWGGKGQSNDLIDYLRLVSGSQTGTEEDPNRVGNSIGAYDLGVQYTFDNWTLRASRLFYLEDTVSTRLRSPWDGMWGLGVRRTDGTGWIEGVLYEHVNTIQQDALSGAPRGRADYYNHYIFESGWTYEDAVLGTPLMTFSPSQNQITNNMIIAHHLGVEGSPTPRLDYTVRLTYSRNYGVCEDQIIRGTCDVLSYDPAPPNQEVRPRGDLRQDRYSVGLEASYVLAERYGLHLRGGVATDLGSLSENRWGLQAGLRWTGTYSLP